MRRILTGLAVALAAVLLAGGCGGGSGGSTATSEAPATEPVTATPQPATATTEEATTEDGGTADSDGTTEDDNGSTTEDGGGTTTGDGGGGADVKATISLVGGEPEGDPQTIEATKGQRVRIVVRSDQPAEVHLHGYDIDKEASPGKPAVLVFGADLEGIFELESHETERVIARLVVNP